jgi:beta-N-acetylhexosaminidase
MLLAFITALSGLELTEREAAVLRAAKPAGVILFARNARDPEQVRRLVDAATAAIGSDDVLVLVDQEGGRVQRLKPPHWRQLPSGAAYAQAYAQNTVSACRAAALAAQLTAMELKAVGINTNCAPVLDVPTPGSHQIIGDRAYGADPAQVVALARAVADGYMAGGVLPVVKHVPGHGRAAADSHLELPVVGATRAELEASDFEPFRRLANLPAAMTAHVLFSAYDPDLPASISPRIVKDVIRGAIGFDGLLISDDLGMKALTGSVAERAQAVLRAGSDLALLCSGDLAETESVAGAVPALDGASRQRFERACAVFGQQRPFDVAEAEAGLADILRAGA